MYAEPQATSRKFAAGTTRQHILQPCRIQYRHTIVSYCIDFKILTRLSELARIGVLNMLLFLPPLGQVAEIHLGWFR